MLYIEFQDPVKLYSLNLVAPPSDQAPRVIKLFVNRANLSFSDGADVEPMQMIELEAEDLLPAHDVELRFVKFQCVKNITLFVETNNGADETVISSLKFFGTVTIVLVVVTSVFLRRDLFLIFLTETHAIRIELLLTNNADGLVSLLGLPRLLIVGEPLAGTNMNDLKKISDE